MVHFKEGSSNSYSYPSYVVWDRATTGQAATGDGGGGEEADDARGTQEGKRKVPQGAEGEENGMFFISQRGGCRMRQVCMYVQCVSSLTRRGECRDGNVCAYAVRMYTVVCHDLRIWWPML